MTGTHLCTCGRHISNNALARASHRKGYRCRLTTYWRDPRNVGYWLDVKAGDPSIGASMSYGEARLLTHLARRIK